MINVAGYTGLPEGHRALAFQIISKRDNQTKSIKLFTKNYSNNYQLILSKLNNSDDKTLKNYIEKNLSSVKRQRTTMGSIGDHIFCFTMPNNTKTHKNFKIFTQKFVIQMLKFYGLVQGKTGKHFLRKITS